MNWKEFLKPNWKKLITLLLLELIVKIANEVLSSLMLMEIVKSTFISGIVLITSSVLSCVFSPFGVAFLQLLGLLNIVYATTKPFQLFLFHIVSYVFATFDTVYRYVLSCAIIWIQNKSKKKK